MDGRRVVVVGAGITGLSAPTGWPSTTRTWP